MIKYFKYFLLFLLIYTGAVKLYAQTDSATTYKYEPPVQDIHIKYGDYQFSTKYDTSEWASRLTVKYKNNIINETLFEGWVDTMNVIDFNGDGKKNLFVSVYTGGAHCCFMIFTGVMENGKFRIPDTLFLGNAGYNIADLDNDDILEIESASDMFAYAFTNYAETRFPPRVYRVKKNKFVDVTKEYPKMAKDLIAELKADLKEFTDKGFECYGKDDETFNTDAGSVKIILAAITACYHILGETEKGYELIKKSYNCPDRDNFIKILREDFKLK